MSWWHVLDSRKMKLIPVKVLRLGAKVAPTKKPSANSWKKKKDWEFKEETEKGLVSPATKIKSAGGHTVALTLQQISLPSLCASWDWFLGHVMWSANDIPSKKILQLNLISSIARSARNYTYFDVRLLITPVVVLNCLASAKIPAIPTHTRSYR